LEAVGGRIEKVVFPEEGETLWLCELSRENALWLDLIGFAGISDRSLLKYLARFDCYSGEIQLETRGLMDVRGSAASTFETIHVCTRALTAMIYAREIANRYGAERAPPRPQRGQPARPGGCRREWSFEDEVPDLDEEHDG